MGEAVRYVGLIGKYVRMERPRDPEGEYDSPDDPPTVGGSGLVVSVKDSSTRVGGWSVLVEFDYGMGCLVVESDEKEWSFTIFGDEETAKLWGYSPLPQPSNKLVGQRAQTINSVLRDELNKRDGTWGETNAQADDITKKIMHHLDRK